MQKQKFNEDPNFNVKLRANKFEAQTMSEPSGVAKLKKREDRKVQANDNNS
jgi:hypothetical protein